MLSASLRAFVFAHQAHKLQLKAAPKMTKPLRFHGFYTIFDASYIEYISHFVKLMELCGMMLVRSSFSAPSHLLCSKCISAVMNKTSRQMMVLELKLFCYSIALI